MEVHEGVYCLRRTLDVDRQSLVVVVLGRAVDEKERVPPELVPLCQHRSERAITCSFGVALEAVQHVCSVEIIHPPEVLLFTVVPGAIGPLMIRRVPDRSLRQITVALIPRSEERRVG